MCIRDRYTGTANAIYQNLDYMETYNPDYVLILSGDHIYKMDYEVMLDFHKANHADVTIAAMPVPMEEARDVYKRQNIFCASTSCLSNACFARLEKNLDAEK